jgi:hypothetical protein
LYGTYEGYYEQIIYTPLKTAREALTSEMECTASTFRDDGSGSVQLQTVRLNDKQTNKHA